MTLKIFYSIVGFILAFASTLIHYSGANEIFILVLATFLVAIFVFKIFLGEDLAWLVSILSKFKIEIFLLSVFVTTPFIGSFINTGNIYNDPKAILETLFRIFLFIFLAYIGSSKYRIYFWRYFLLFFAFGYVLFIASYIIFPNSEYSNSSGIIPFLGAIFIHFKLHNFLRIVLFIFTLIFLYYFMEARTIAVAYVFFHFYMITEKWIGIGIKKHISNVSLVAIISVIVLFIYIDENYGIWNAITSGRGTIWLHYLSYSYENDSLLFGIGHSKDYLYSLIPESYSGNPSIKMAMILGGAHNSFVYMLITKGIIGFMALFAFIYLLIIRLVFSRQELNIGLYFASIIMLLALGQSTIGGLTFESLLILISLTVPMNGLTKIKGY